MMAELLKYFTFLIIVPGLCILFFCNLAENTDAGLLKAVFGLLAIISCCASWWFLPKIMGGDKFSNNYANINNLNNEERKILQKYVKSKLRESIKEYQKAEVIEYKKVKQVERDKDIREVCLIRAGYQCEISKEHKSFVSANGYQYIESHHIIPLKYQNQFDFNLDSVENLIALCPNCHKAIHYGDRRTKENILRQICNIRPIVEYKKLLTFYE